MSTFEDSVVIAQRLDLPAGRQGAAKEYFVYIIRSKSSGKFYTGMTSDFSRRIKEHNQKLSNTLTTKNTKDYVPVFVQLTDSRINARKLEKYLKSGTGREFRDEIINQLGRS